MRKYHCHQHEALQQIVNTDMDGFAESANSEAQKYSESESFQGLFFGKLANRSRAQNGFLEDILHPGF